MRWMKQAIEEKREKGMTEMDVMRKNRESGMPRTCILRFNRSSKYSRDDREIGWLESCWTADFSGVVVHDIPVSREHFIWMITNWPLVVATAGVPCRLHTSFGCRAAMEKCLTASGDPLLSSLERQRFDILLSF